MRPAIITARACANEPSLDRCGDRAGDLAAVVPAIGIGQLDRAPQGDGASVAGDGVAAASGVGAAGVAEGAGLAASPSTSTP